MTSVLLHNIFSWTGIIAVCELIVFVPFYCYYILTILSKSYLTVPLLFLSYPIAIFSFCGFSICAITNYLQTHPYEIGQKEKFYKVLYEYCNQSRNKQEFNSKVIILNYLCIKTYKQKLKENAYHNSEYYQFANWLSNKSKSDLLAISIQEFQGKFKGVFDDRKILGIEQKVISSFLNIKIFQIWVRAIMITIALLIDIINLLTHGDNDSPFVQKYEMTILISGTIGIVLVVIWCIGMYLDHKLFRSNWNYFCRNMITSKDTNFILSETPHSFTKKCENIYDTFKSALPLCDNAIMEDEEVTQTNTNSILLSGNALLIHVICASIIMTKHRGCINDIPLFSVCESIMIIFIFGLIINDLIIHYPKITKIYYDSGILVGILFASHVSCILSILISRFDYHHCHYNLIRVLIVTLHAWGSVVCLGFELF